MDAVSERQFGEWVSARLPGLLRLGHLLTGDRSEAEDLVQTALVRTYRAWPRVDEPDAFVRRVLVNARNSWWARRRVTAELVDVPDEPDAGFEERDAMWRALSALPRKQRAVLVLRYYEELTESEIAAVLDCSSGTVKSQASKALAKLRAQLREPVGCPEPEVRRVDAEVQPGAGKAANAARRRVEPAGRERVSDSGHEESR